MPSSTTDAGSADGDYLEFAVTTSSGSTTYKVDLVDSDTIKDVVDKVNAATNGAVQASYDEVSGQITYASANDFTVAHNDSTDTAVVGTKLTVTPASASVSFATDAQITKLVICFKELGITDREDRVQFLRDAIGRHIDSSKEMTRAEASAVIDKLESAPPSDEPPLDEEPF